MATESHPAIPWRHDGDGPGLPRPAGLPLPPGPMAIVRGRRPRKHWRYVGIFGEEVMACAAIVRVGPATQAFWAVWERREQALHERTVPGRGGVRLPDGRVTLQRRDVAIDVELAPFGDPIEVVSPHGSQYIWTRKQWVWAIGRITVEGRAHTMAAPALIDCSDGYHARDTRWRWAAGAGRLHDGRSVAWNLTVGIHDGPQVSERTLWIDGVAQPLGPATIAPDLTTIRFDDGSELRFNPEAERRRDENLLLVASRYRQPFGAFEGTLPGGLRLESGQGVMEDHEARW